MPVRRSLLFSVAMAGLWVTASAPCVHAQTASQQDAAEEQSEFPWHLINTAIFALGFGYAVWKYSPAFFNARSADIQKAIQDATGLKLDADFRYSEIDRKIATLPAEIQRLRDQSKIEMDREGQRRQAETQRELRQIENSLQAEIEASRTEGTRQVRRRAALLALESAERQLEGRAGSGTADGLVGDFVHLVERGKS